MTNKVENYQNQIDEIEINIDSGETDSSAIDLFGTTLAGLYIPSGFTGSSIQYQATYDGQNFFAIRDSEDNAVTSTVSPSSYVALNPILFYGVRTIKLIAGASQTSDIIIQGALYSI